MQYVVRMLGTEGPKNPEMAALLEDMRVLGAGSRPGEVRDLSAGEMDAFADVLKAMSDLSPSLQQVTYHPCRHDEGVGNCGAVVEIR